MQSIYVHVSREYIYIPCEKVKESFHVFYGYIQLSHMEKLKKFHKKIIHRAVSYKYSYPMKKGQETFDGVQARKNYRKAS